MKNAALPINPDQPTFLTERRGGQDPWEDERTVVIAVALPSGDELTTNDEITADLAAAPDSIGVDATDDDSCVTAQLEIGSWIGGGKEAEVESTTTPWFSVTLSESAFRDAWGDWLHQ